MLKPQGLTLEGVKKRIREQLMVQRVIAPQGRPAHLGHRAGDRPVPHARTARSSRPASPSRRATSCSCPSPAKGEEGWTAARLRADEVYGHLLEGQDFVELAKEYSEDPSGKDGGSLGTLKRGELAPGDRGRDPASHARARPRRRSARRSAITSSASTRARRSPGRRSRRPAARSARSSTARSTTRGSRSGSWRSGSARSSTSGYVRSAALTAAGNPCGTVVPRRTASQPPRAVAPVHTQPAGDDHLFSDVARSVPRRSRCRPRRAAHPDSRPAGRSGQEARG